MDFILPQLEIENGTWLDERVEPAHWNLRYWHVVFMGIGVFLSVVVMLCCCFRFRIPRTKQDIEADYQRRILSKKFREKLEMIKNTEMENMDLSKALERIQSEILLDQYEHSHPHETANTVSTTKENANLIEDTVRHKKKRGGGIHV